MDDEESTVSTQMPHVYYMRVPRQRGERDEGVRSRQGRVGILVGVAQENAPMNDMHASLMHVKDPWMMHDLLDP